jgi:hypothetical protein
VTVVAALAAIFPAAAVTYVAAVHNPQGAFSRAGGGLDPWRLAPVFASWFLPAFAVAMFIGFAITYEGSPGAQS